MADKNDKLWTETLDAYLEPGPGESYSYITKEDLRALFMALFDQAVQGAVGPTGPPMDPADPTTIAAVKDALIADTAFIDAVKAATTAP
jgi:hypothetical protein